MARLVERWCDGWSRSSGGSTRPAPGSPGFWSVRVVRRVPGRRGRMSVVTYVGVGSNLGDRASNCRAARAPAAGVVREVLRRASSVYETEPTGPVRDQPGS